MRGAEQSIEEQFPIIRDKSAGVAGQARSWERHFRRSLEPPFTAEERDRVTILFGGLTWKHEKLIQAVLQSCGYRCQPLPNATLASYHLGRSFGNPGQCNPTYFTVGSLIEYLRELKAQSLSHQGNP